MIRPLQQDSIIAVARLLAGSMRDNPLQRRQMPSGYVLGAYQGDLLVGVAAVFHLAIAHRGGFEAVTEQPILGAMQRHPAKTT